MKIEKGNSPTPDPNWDYYDTWERLQEGKSQIEALLSQIATLEKATEISDQAVADGLAKIANNLLNAYNFKPLARQKS